MIQHSEPLIPSMLLKRPWQKVGTDLFEWKKTDYLLVVDYYSRFIEIAKLTTTTASTVILHLKSIFSRHGIPECVMPDNGPQYSADKFKTFSEEYGFEHTSSPRYPQANGAAERAVKTVKRLLEKNTDPYMAMLIYRSTPLENGNSPSELLMGRKLRTTLPITSDHSAERHTNEKDLRARMKKNFDERHRAKNLPPLRPGDNIWIPGNRSGGIVLEESNPRSYTVQTEQGTFRRNRRD